MLSWATRFPARAPVWAVALGITLIVGSLYIMNVGLDEVFNPRLREL